MRIIITGGTGLIGKPLTAALVSDGHEVIILSRNPADQAAKLPAGVKVHKWDGRSADGWGHLADGAGAIINLAGESIAGTGSLPSRWSDARKQVIQESRIYAGLAVVDAVEAAGDKPKIVIQASAIGYYGQHTHDSIFSEDSPPGDDFMGQSCVIWEDSTASIAEMGVRRAVIRTGLVQTMAGGPLSFSVFQFKTFTGGRLGGGDQWMSWIHMQDEIAAIRFIMENDQASGAFNLTAPNPVTNKEFTKTLSRVLNRPGFFFVPETAMRLALGEIATLVVDGQRVLPNRLLELGFQFRYPDLFYALRDILA